MTLSPPTYMWGGSLLIAIHSSRISLRNHGFLAVLVWESPISHSPCQKLGSSDCTQDAHLVNIPQEQERVTLRKQEGSMRV